MPFPIFQETKELTAWMWILRRILPAVWVPFICPKILQASFWGAPILGNPNSLQAPPITKPPCLNKLLPTMFVTPSCSRKMCPDKVRLLYREIQIRG